MLKRTTVLVMALALGLLLLTSHEALGQSEGDGRVRGAFIGFLGFGAEFDGAAVVTFHPGVGGDVLFGNVGVTGTVGYLAPFEALGDGLGTFSPGLLIAFSKTGTVPFVTAGYSLFFREGSLSGFFVGGGVNVWKGERTGFRVELHADVLSDTDIDFNVIELRFGVIAR